ncbi:hypothetical protein FRB96_008050 [Tulasnella sp. 330]|nr:hypothetical protein FRB96_008050 [Tulasnella sp. 330]
MAITGTFVVPTPKVASGSASPWVGFDGDTCGNAILLTGVDFTVTYGKVSYNVTMSLTSTYALYEENAERITENYEEGSSLVTLTSSGTMEFTGASAGLVAGGTLGPSTADTINIERNFKVLISVTLGSPTVTVKYIGS